MRFSATVFVVFFLLLVVGHTGYTAPPSKPLPAKSINIIVILDTSDRISTDKNPGQADIDTVIAEGIVDFFEEKLVRPELYIGYPHRLVFVVPEQIGANSISFDILKDRGGGAPRFNKQRKKLCEDINDSYLSLRKQVKFTGADIWKWFRDSAAFYLDQNAFNYVICLSDGYLNFDPVIEKDRLRRSNKTTFMQVAKFRSNPNWEEKFDREGYGLLEINKNFSSYNVKFLMVEIKIKPRHMGDLPILEKYWRTWFESMGIIHSDFWPHQNDTNIVIENIKKFISINP